MGSCWQVLQLLLLTWRCQTALSRNMLSVLNGPRNLWSISLLSISQALQLAACLMLRSRWRKEDLQQQKDCVLILPKRGTSSAFSILAPSGLWPDWLILSQVLPEEQELKWEWRETTASGSLLFLLLCQTAVCYLNLVLQSQNKRKKPRTISSISLFDPAF